jgi:hypothetical protein
VLRINREMVVFRNDSSGDLDIFRQYKLSVYAFVQRWLCPTSH